MIVIWIHFLNGKDKDIILSKFKEPRLLFK